MAFYDGLFNTFGLKGWCGEGCLSAPMSMAELLAKTSGKEAKSEFFHSLPGQSERELPSIIQSRDVTKGIENGF